MGDNNVLNYFGLPGLDKDNVFNVGGTTAFSKDAIITVIGDPALGEPDYTARWVDFVRAVSGGGSRIKDISAAEYPVTVADYFLKADTSSNNVNANLPPSADFYDAVNDIGYTLILKKMSSSNTAKFVPDGIELIDGASDVTLISLNDISKITALASGWMVVI